MNKNVTHFVFVMAGEVCNAMIYSLLKNLHGLTMKSQKSATTNIIYRKKVSVKINFRVTGQTQKV